jgi:hypothetical protein
MENKTYEFMAEIKKVPDIDGAYIEFPYDLRTEFGKGRIKVYAEFDGEPYNGSIVNMGLKNSDGTTCYIIGIKKDIRKRINKSFGDKINVKIKEMEK